MKNLLRGIPAALALAGAVLPSPRAFAAPPTAVSITAPAAGSLGTLSSPNGGVTLSATATASGGGAFITQVDFRVNGNSVGIATSAPFSVTWTPTASGSFSITAIATDSSSASNNTLTSAAVAVTVDGVRSAAIATPGSGATITQNSQVVIRATATATDTVVGNVEFFLGGTSLGAAVTSAPYFIAPTVTTAPGTYNLVARATSSNGGSTWESTATYPINIVAQPGQPPTVSFVAPGTTDVISVGTPVTIVATASDLDGFIPNSAPGGVSFYADGELIGNDLTAPYSVSWTPALAKSVSLVAVVTDDKGNSRSATRSVTVLAVAPTVSLTAPANNSNATVGASVTVSANATAGLGTTVTSVQFLADGVAIGAADTTAPYSVAWTPAASGTVALTARVTDSNSTAVTSAAVNVNVSSAPGTLSVSLTAPANGDTVALGRTLDFTATASAAGSNTVTRVDFLTGSTVLGTDLTAPYTFTWTPTASGVFPITARVTDSTGATAISPIVNVSVTAPTVALTAPSSSNSIVVGTPTTVSATAGAVGTATVVSVEFFAGSTSLGSDTTSPYSVTYTPTSAGTVALTARVTDSNGAVVTSAATNVTVATAVPTVSVTAPTNGTAIALGTSATLTATASGTGGATINRVDFLAGTTVVGTALAAPFSITWTPSASGIFALTARATDSNGATTTSSIVNVNVTAPSVSITSPSPTASLTVGSATTVAANASAVGTATVASVEFFAGSTSLGIDNTAPYSVSYTPSAAGTVALTARVIDSNGAAVTSSAVSLTVANAAGPTVSLTAPANGAVVTVGTGVTVSANATAGGAALSQVQFFAGTTLIGSSATAPYSITWTPSAAGTFNLTARAFDTAGASTTSTAVSVTAVTATSVAFTAPAANSTAALGTALTVTASATPVAGATIASVAFSSTVGGVTTALGTVNTAPYSLQWTPTTVGATTLTATATDSLGNTATSTVAVTVGNSAPTVTLTAPTPGQVFTAGLAVSLSATATAGSGATVAQVQFRANNTTVATVTTGAGGVFSGSWTPAAAGNFNLTAVVTDTNGASTTSTAVAVTVNAGPTVAISSPAAGATIAAGTTVTLAATAAAPAGATVSKVEFLVGGALINTATIAPYQVSWTPTTAGTSTLTARVTDSNGSVVTSSAVGVTITGTSSVSLAVSPAGSAIPVNSARSLTVTVTSSVGVAYVEFYYGTTLIGTDTTPPYSIVFTAPNETGSRTLRARLVEVNGTTTDSLNVPITIITPSGTSPSAGILSPASGSFVAAGATVAITGTATDADGAIASVQVFVNGASLGNAALNGSNWSINWTPTSSGVASITAIATDNSGNATAAPTVGVNVTDSTSPTVSTLLLPGSAGAPAASTLPSGATRNLVVTATPASGRAVVRVEFFLDGTKVGEDTTVPYTHRFVAPALTNGENSRAVVLTARATDNAGAARDAQVPLFIVSPVGTPPTVNLITPANGATAFPNTDISLAATAIGTNGANIVSVQFFVNGNTTGITTTNPVTAAPYTGTFRPTQPGTYVIDAIATDDRGNTTVSNSATVTAAFNTPTIAITSPNPNATARATPNVPLTITAQATVQTGTGASVLLVEFLLDDVQIGARTSATNAALGTYSFSWLPTTAQLGTRRLTARVTDTNSQVATSAPVTVNVANAVGTPPAITISTTPIPGAGLQTLSTVNFIANAFANGTGTTLTNVEFFLNDASIGLAAREQTTNLYRLTYDFSRIDFANAPVNPNNPSQFLLPLYAIARDSNNNQTVSATSTLTINAATSAAPSNLQLFALTATTVTQGSQVILIPTFTDVDGTVTQIQLYVNGVINSAVGSPTSGQTFIIYNANTPGRFNLFAVATDDTGNTAVSSPAIVVQVNAVNAPTTTIAQPANNNTVSTVNAPIFLEGTAAATGTNLIPNLQFVVTGSNQVRTTINGTRVGNTTTYRAIWTPVTADTYTLSTQSTVSGVQGTSTATRTVVVNNLVGIAPTVSINIPGTATTASSVNFTATATDSDGSVSGVEFFVNRNSIGQATRDPIGNTWRLTASFVGADLGATEVVARVRDSAGNVAASTTNNITVVAASSIAPSVTISSSSTNPAFNRQVQLTANARDSDGSISSVQYFANGTSLGTSTNAGTNFLVNWSPTASGVFNVYAVATDNTGNTTVAATVPVTVRRNNPVLEDAAFILQSYQDIANTSAINPLVFDQLDAQLGAGSLSRADLIATLTDEAGFTAPVNALATYYVLMGQWPTPANYTTVLANARGGLANAVGQILNSNEYFAKYGVVPTVALLNSPTSLIPADTFIARLWSAAGLGTPSALQNLQFRSNNVLGATLGRGYNPIGLNQAISEFITNTNSANTALFARARAAALFYQLARPAVSVTVDEITARINALLPLKTDAEVAAAVLKDVLYGYRYVTITKHPQSLVVSPRSGVIFSVEAQGAPPLAYQWLLNGAPIPGGTNAFLSLTNVGTGNAGSYTVAITSSQATATSDAATLELSNVPTRLANISTRGVTTGAGANVLIGGFVVSGTANQTRQMLIRVIGPTIGQAPFNVAGVLANPRLEIYSGTNPNPVLVNDDWATQTAGQQQVQAIVQATQRAGAFALNQNSSDAVVLATLPPGPYTVQAKSPAANPNATGVVLIEVYDVTQGAAAGPKAANVSTRGTVGTGANILIAGFVVNGEVSRRMLIRGAGPTLAGFGVAGVLADPQLTLSAQATGQVIRTNDNWASGEDASIIASAASAAGAFPFANGSRDAAMIVMLPPGAYTAQLSGVGGTTGVGIVEVYDVDP